MNTDYSYLYNEEYYGNEINASRYLELELQVRCYENAVVLPACSFHEKNAGGVVLQDGAYLKNSGLNYEESIAYPFEEGKLQQENEKAIYFGKFLPIWGHNLTDNLRFFWTFLSESFLEEYKDYKLVYIADDRYQMSRNFCALLEKLGVDCTKLEKVTVPTRYSKLMIPDECFRKLPDGKRVFTKEYRLMISKIKSGVSERNDFRSFDKIYFSYQKYGTGYQIGEDKLEEFFGELGYRIIYPEEYTLEQQLEMLSGCKKFASTVGSCSHNSVFLGEQAECILIPRNPVMNEYQLALNEVNPLSIRYADASLSILRDKREEWTGPYYLFVSEQLADCANANHLYEKYKKDRFKLYKKYVFRAVWCRKYLEEWMFWDYYPERLTAEIRKYLKKDFLLFSWNLISKWKSRISDSKK